MAGKKSKGRARRTPPRAQVRGGGPAVIPNGTTREEARQDRREEARRQAQARYRRLQRRRLLKRATAGAAVAAVIGAGVFYFAAKAQAKHGEVDKVNQAALAAGCTPITGEPDLGNPHLAQGENHQYAQHPATSGPHDPAPLPGDQHTYTAPVGETHAVHNLEHGYVLVYYRADGTGALPPDVVTSLADMADSETKVIMAPYPSLDDGKALAIAAWDELLQCPDTVTSVQATTLARSFIDLFRAGGKAPEPAAP